MNTSLKALLIVGNHNNLRKKMRVFFVSLSVGCQKIYITRKCTDEMEI